LADSRDDEDRRASLRFNVARSPWLGIRPSGRHNAVGSRVVVRITNSGNTPAEIIAHDLQLITSGFLIGNPTWPPIPTAPVVSTLMPRDEMRIWLNFNPIDDVVKNDFDLYVVGWVVYRDKFGGLHRNHYARAYKRELSPNMADNNLVFVTQPGYNFEEDASAIRPTQRWRQLFRRS
jgi:hypothetical protein